MRSAQYGYLKIDWVSEGAKEVGVRHAQISKMAALITKQPSSFLRYFSKI